MKILLHFLIVFVLIFLVDCYRVSEKRASQDIYFNHNIIGSWIHKILWIDYGYQIKRLDFYSNGNVSFYPDFERINSLYHSGRFKINNDTLQIQLLNNSFEEIFVYKIYTSQLQLQKIPDEYQLSIPIANINEEIWEIINN